MIQKSFIFLKGISYNKEKSLYKQGIRSWNSFLETQKIKGISKEKKIILDKELIEAKHNLYTENTSYFSGVLPQKENYRLYPLFQDETLFLDIEIDSKRNIILIGLFNGFKTKFMIKGFNLYKDILKKELENYKLIVTFNGSSFDLPLIEKQLDLPITLPHIDLKHLCNKVGLKGSLKEIELILNLKRPKHLLGHPVDAWKAAHASQDDRYLKALLNYNEEDLVNLRPILEYCYKQLEKEFTLE